ncbi:hypothetical protein FHS18_003130 [Paenibacillus phyllosphaerae]|uniref:Permuted papain-like amidase enzyme, YaeF/YiiX, C92 family n=1 Tax=Paenibacillus phyllosphaerae TaxID=274593 RepID=A0A7W5AYR2_9BACL|nr:YiiX/YebB-like N1pC/P60 family cysteine hydrolase [Paenibacillus phyllosphaerae]MBB3111062.1 hypothetical protein [Paenibacillus phyllosphaerae]
MERSRYEEVRGCIHNGDLLFCSGNYVISQLIRRISDYSFSHAAFVMWIHERLMVLESVEDVGVRMVPLSSYIADYDNSGKPYNGDVYIGRHRVMNRQLEQEDSTKDAKDRLMHRALDLMGKRYDTEDLSKIALRLTTGLGKRDEDDAYICSEYVAECFAQNNIAFGSSGGFVLPKHIGEDPDVELLYKLI